MGWCYHMSRHALGFGIKGFTSVHELSRGVVRNKYIWRHASLPSSQLWASASLKFGSGDESQPCGSNLDSCLRSENLLDQVGSFGEREYSGCGVMDEGCNWTEECGLSVSYFLTDFWVVFMRKPFLQGLRTWKALKSCIWVVFVVGLSSASVGGSLEMLKEHGLILCRVILCLRVWLCVWGFSRNCFGPELLDGCFAWFFLPLRASLCLPCKAGEFCVKVERKNQWAWNWMMPIVYVSGAQGGVLRGILLQTGTSRIAALLWCMRSQFSHRGEIWADIWNCAQVLIVIHVLCFMCLAE